MSWGQHLAETGRMIEIARAARPFFDVRFLSYGGRFEELIEEEGFKLTRMEPRLTRQKPAVVVSTVHSATTSTSCQTPFPAPRHMGVRALSLPPGFARV
jgi:hypothetical protein